MERVTVLIFKPSNIQISILSKVKMPYRKVDAKLKYAKGR
jgi:hypothetical protein